MTRTLVAFTLLGALVALGTSRTAKAQDQGLSWQIFSDVNLRASDASGDHPAFALGGVDFFGTAVLSDKVRVLSEDVLEILGSEVVFDLERIYLEWDVADALTLRFGRTHTPLGYYTQTFHHASLFQLSSGRPKLLSFEDDGGALPAHMIGIEAFGEREMGETVLGYTLGVGNGRGQYSDQVQSTFDGNNSKSVVARLTLAPGAIEGLEVGVSGYFDRIPKGFTNALGTLIVPENITEIIGGAHVAYFKYPMEFLGEIYYVSHKEDNTSKSTKLLGGFAQFGYAFEDWTPYTKVDFVKRDTGDAFFNASGSAEKVFSVDGGLRYNLNEKAVVKVQYTRDFEQKTNAGTAQVAFGF